MRAAFSDGDEARQAPSAGQVVPGGGGGEAQGVDPGEGGASVPVPEAALRVREGALPGSGEEQAADRAAAGFREPVDRGPLRDWLKRGTIAPVLRRNGGKRDGSRRIRGFRGDFRNKRKHFSPRKWISDCEARARRPAASGNPA